MIRARISRKPKEPNNQHNNFEIRAAKDMTAGTAKESSQTGAALLVKSLENQGVEHIFGVPGAKIDKVFDTLLDSRIKTIVCRHEQNAAFIAGSIGRLTGKAGVVLVTSGPGCSNLATGLATATSEGDRWLRSEVPSRFPNGSSMSTRRWIRSAFSGQSPN